MSMKNSTHADGIIELNDWAVTLESGQLTRAEENDLEDLHIWGKANLEGHPSPVRLITSSICDCHDGIVITRNGHEYALGKPSEVYSRLFGSLGLVERLESVIRKKRMMYSH